MKIIISMVLTIIFLGWLRADPVDVQLARIENEMANIKDNQRRIEALLQRNSKILYGNGKEGMVTIIRLNSEHRSIAEKFTWLVITAIIMNAGSTVYIIVEMLKQRRKG